MNEVLEITVQKIWPPYDEAKPWRDGKKRGKVVSSNDEKFQVAETMLREFSEGETCKVEFKTFGDKANPGREIVKKIGGGNGVIQSKQNVRQRMDPADARGAFISMLCDAWAQAGMLAIDRDQVAKARTEAGAGYDMSHNPQRRDDLQDEIPY